MAYGDFGDLRALLHDAPSRGVWERLCAEIRLWREPELSQLALPYVLSQLERWPDSLRVMRHEWTLSLLRGRARGAHVTALARVLELENTAPTLDEWLRLDDYDWSSLRTLKLERIAQTSIDDLFRSARRTSWFTDHVTALELSYNGPASGWAQLFASGTLSNLRALSLGGPSLRPDDRLELATADWPHLEHLGLDHGHLLASDRRNGTRPSGLAPLHEDEFAPGLTSFRLTNMRHIGRVPIELRDAPWLPSLKRLVLSGEQRYRDRATNGRAYARNLPSLLQHGELLALEHLTLTDAPDVRALEALTRNPSLGALTRVELPGLWRWDDLSYVISLFDAPDSLLPTAVREQWSTD